MQINAKHEVVEELKRKLHETGTSAVRISIGDCPTCEGARASISFDRQRDSDDFCEIDGVKFVADNDFAFLLSELEIVINEGNFVVRRQGGLCGI